MAGWAVGLRFDELRKWVGVGEKGRERERETKKQKPSFIQLQLICSKEEALCSSLPSHLALETPSANLEAAHDLQLCVARIYENNSYPTYLPVR